MFEYAVMASKNNLANKKLREILSASYCTDPYHQIDHQVLRAFFTNCLSIDNFNGLGFLMGYVNKNNIDIRDWPLSKFKSAVNFYLNMSVNNQNLLIFTNFYTFQLKQKLEVLLQERQKTIAELGEVEKYQLHEELFKGIENLVDMRSLFNHLVTQIGDKDAIDPVTKQDALWAIIDFFTSNGMYELSLKSQSLNNAIEDKDIARYFKNHLNASSTFDKITRVMLRLNEYSHSNFQNFILQELRLYSAQNGSLPFSFDRLKTRKAYASLKKGALDNKIKVSQKTLEYFLDIFKQQQMWPEIIDLCENFNQLSQQTSGMNEIKSYYMSEALLKIPSSSNYHKVIQEAVFQNQELPQSAGYITSMTKAYFKDGSTSHAVAFFQNSIDEIREIKTKRESLIESMFDVVYSQENPRDMTFQQFRVKYFQLFKLSESLIKESFAVTTLRRVLKDKDFDDIQNLFSLYLVIQEEDQRLAKFTTYKTNQLRKLRDTPLQDIQELDYKEREELESIRERRMMLESIIREGDVNAIHELQDVVQDLQVSVFKKVNTKQADELEKIFNIMSFEQLEEIIERIDPIQEAAKISYIEDTTTPILEEFTQQVSDKMDLMMKEHENMMFEPRMIPSKSIINSLQEVHEDMPPEESDTESENEKNDEKSEKQQEEEISRKEDEKYLKKFPNPRKEMEVLAFNRYQLRNEITEEEDTQTIYKNAHNATLFEMYVDLMEALNSRKEDVLLISLQIFNKIQSKHVKVQKLDVPQGGQQIELEKFSENISKYDMLLNNLRSPILSTLQLKANIQKDFLENSVDDLFQDSFDVLDKNIELEQFVKETQLLNEMNQQVSNIEVDLKQMTQLGIKLNQDSGKSGPFEEAQRIQSEQKQNSFAETLESRIQKLYEEYKESLEQNKDATTADELPREIKLHLLRDVFTVEYEGAFTNNLFPEFYAQDLVIFGLDNNVPEAVRLGEKMMSENGFIMAKDLQKAVKDYVLRNAEQYNTAIKATGPIDNSSLYKRSRLQAQNGEQPVIFSWDDPYWQDIMSKSKRRTLAWRRPSILAWDHKKHGIIGEVLDMQKIEENQRKLRMQMRI